MSAKVETCDFVKWLEASSGQYGYQYWNDPNHVFYGNRNMNAPQNDPNAATQVYQQGNSQVNTQGAAQTKNIKNDPTVVNSPTQQVSQRVDQLWQLYQSIDNRLSAIEKMKSAVQR